LDLYDEFGATHYLRAGLVEFRPQLYSFKK